MYSVCHVAINTLVKVLTKKYINFVDVKQMFISVIFCS